MLENGLSDEIEIFINLLAPSNKNKDDLDLRKSIIKHI